MEDSFFQPYVRKTKLINFVKFLDLTNYVFISKTAIFFESNESVHNESVHNESVHNELYTFPPTLTAVLRGCVRE